MEVINLRERFGRRFPIVMEEYGPHATVDDAHYQIIPGGRGHVYAWDSERLAASTNTPGKITNRIKALPGVEVWQDGDDGCTVLFPPELLDQVADLLKLRRRRQVDEQERERLRELGRQYGFRPRQTGFQSDLDARHDDSEASDDQSTVLARRAIFRRRKWRRSRGPLPADRLRGSRGADESSVGRGVPG